MNAEIEAIRKKAQAFAVDLPDFTYMVWNSMYFGIPGTTIFKGEDGEDRIEVPPMTHAELKAALSCRNYNR